MRNERQILVLAVAGLWLGALAVRLYDLQVRRHQSFCDRAERQQQRVVVLDPPRGTIYDARGRELAVSVEVDSLAAAPVDVEDPASTAAALAATLGLDRARLEAALATDREFTWVKRKLDPPAAESVRALDLPGVFTLPESKRYYPMRRLAAAVLGYVGTDNSGLGGIEYLYDEIVASEPGLRRVVRDARRATVLHPALERTEARPGQSLHLTLDATVQSVVERELAAAVRESGARRATAVVLDPQTGAVLAMASVPGFDPNRFNASPPGHWRNQAVADAYEPGSTFKMVTVAAALEANVVDPLEKLDCGWGGITLDRVRISDHHPFGELTAREIIARSSNVGAIKLGLAAGRQRLYDTIDAFGFGRPTGVDLPNESAGIVRPIESWSKLSPAYISFGQGISITALQLANAFAAIANGGYLLRPYVVAATGRPGEKPRPLHGRQVVGLPISPSSVTQVRSMLESVVIEGTGRAAAVAGYRVAGKTGTAEKAIPGRGYAANKFVASFVGFTPIRNPALACAVVVDEPWPRYHGGEVAAPVFAAIARRVLLYLGVPPDGERPVPEPRPLLAAAPPAGAGAPEAGTPDAGSPEIEVRPAQPPGTVPDLTGLSARQAVARSSGAGLEPELHGHGRVARQLPPPGTPLEAAAGGIELWLAEGAS